MFYICETDAKPFHPPRMQKILVVEDEQMLAKIIGMKLEEEQYEVSHAYDGEEAYNALCAANVPDLVLLDVLLPKMSGFDVLERMQTEKRSIPKIIVFSNFAQKADVERAKALGAIDYIVKAAFSPAEIIAKIKEVFAASATPAAPASGEVSSASPAAAAPVAESSAYQSFDSLKDVMPMSEVLHPNEPTNNP
jgi:DNA-binding response OmpR family regulator